MIDDIEESLLKEELASTRAALEECVRALKEVRADYAKTRSFLMDECEGVPANLADEREGDVEACDNFIAILDKALATARNALEGK